MEKISWRKLICLVCLIVLFSAVRPVWAQSASLYLSPSSGSHSLGENFSVNVLVDSSEVAVNAVSGAVDFPADKLEVLSLSKNNSIINLWVQEPKVQGQNISFEGIILNPGFKGAGGKILTVNFKTKATGKTALTFSSGSVLANDGEGTNIFSGSVGATVDLGTGQPAPKESGGLPPAPKIFSSTHPDSARWYSKNEARFGWAAPAGVNAVRLLIGQIPQAQPTVLYAPPISSKTVGNLVDGVWYFHAQLRNANGWGGISHFRLQIDATKPESLSIEESTSTPRAEGRAVFIIKAEDATSGVAYYQITVDGAALQEWRDDGKHFYETSVLESGSHLLKVKAIDSAGNFLEAQREFVIIKSEPIPVSTSTITTAPPELAVAAYEKSYWRETLGYFIGYLPFIIIIALLIVLFWVVRAKRCFSKEIGLKNVYRAEQLLHQTFDSLRRSIQEKIRTRDRTRGREDREKIIKECETALDEAENFLRKKLF